MNILFKFIVTVFFFAFLAWTAGVCWFTYYVVSASPQNIERKSDAIVVLTGGGNHRIEEGLELFSAHRAPALFITGVHPTVNIINIRAMWEGDTPLPKCCIILGHNAKTTKENAVETLAWITQSTDIKTIRLVTSNYHMKRAYTEMQSALSDVEIIPHPISQANVPMSSEYFWKLIFSEYHKILVRQAGLWITQTVHTLGG